MTPDLKDKRAATAKAAHWLIALEEARTTALRARFTVWLAERPAHARAWANTAEVNAMIAKRPRAAQ